MPLLKFECLSQIDRIITQSGGKTQFYLYSYMFILFSYHISCVDTDISAIFYRNSIIWEQPVQEDSTFLFFPIVRCFFLRFIQSKLSPYK